MTLPGDPSSAPDLSPGDANEWVTELQRLLRDLDHLHHDPVGTFDEDTARAVTEFQNAAGLPADGLVGHATWTALYAAAPAGHYGAVEPDFGGQPAAGQPSEDGAWIWDGDRWVGAGDGRPEPSGVAEAEVATDGEGKLSADRQWRWDGVEWQPANP